jgi:hypothetical protein
MRTAMAIFAALVLLAACGSNSNGPSGPGTVTITCADIEASGTASKCGTGTAALAVGDPPMQGGTVSASDPVNSIATVSYLLHLTAQRDVILMGFMDSSCNGSGLPGYAFFGGAQQVMLAGDNPGALGGGCSGIPGTRVLYAVAYDPATIWNPATASFPTGGLPSGWTPGADPANLLDQVSVQFTMTP